MPQRTAAKLPSEYGPALGRAVAHLRRQHEITGAALAKATGLHLTTIRQFEADGRGSLAVLHTLAIALGSTPGAICRAAEKILGNPS